MAEVSIFSVLELWICLNLFSSSISIRLSRALFIATQINTLNLTYVIDLTSYVQLKRGLRLTYLYFSEA